MQQRKGILIITARNYPKFRQKKSRYSKFWRIQRGKHYSNINKIKTKLMGWSAEHIQNPTPAENRFEDLLKELSIPYLKQPYCYQRRAFIPDFVIDAPYFSIIEIDGSSHDDRHKEDRSGDYFFALKGYETKRYTNNQVFKQIDFVKSDLLSFLNKRKELNEGCTSKLIFYKGVRSYNLSPGASQIQERSKDMPCSAIVPA